MDIYTLRTTLLITLSILVVVLAWRLLKRRVVAHDLPAISHAELLALEVAYHPARLRVRVMVPLKEVLRSAVLDASHTPIHCWDDEQQEGGTHVMERMLPSLPDGSYYFELSTATQRTVRKFRLQQA